MNRSPALVRVLPLACLACWVWACSGEGRPTSAGQSEQAIVGGVNDSSHPAVVFLTNPVGNTVLECTGSLIAPKLVLTARHCVSVKVTEGIGCNIYGTSTNGDHVGADYLASNIKVHTGMYPGSAVASGVQILHPPGNSLCNNDLALIVLNTAVGGVAPLPIRLDWGPAIGESCTAVGYGAINDNQMGAGTRRKRDGVPVLSAGQDWNWVIGAGEIAAGQAVCSGDSGGPLLSASGAVIGVASRVQNCSDPNASAKYVRVDYHKALILQAFAAAGASPLPDPGSPTSPPQKQPTGQGPCTTGVQCLSFMCQTAGGYCDEFCNNSSCPTGMFCADGQITLDGQVIKDKLCQPLPSGAGCEACRTNQCVNVISTCFDNPDCKALLACVDGCKDDACLSACKAANPAGFDDYDLVEYCSCQSCPADCAYMCPTGSGGSGGGGGAAGAAGTSGSGGGVPTGGTGGAPPWGGSAGNAAADAGPDPQFLGSSSSSSCNTSGRSAPGSWWPGLCLLALCVRRRLGRPASRAPRS